jgi:outer membrane immunogenic protein
VNKTIAPNAALAAALVATALTAPTAASAQSGFRADIHAGLDNISTHQRTDVGVNGATTREKDEGVIYGGEIGYDVDLAGFTLGAYAGLDGSSIKECSEVFAEVETCAKSGRNITLGARAGIRAMPRLLIYAKGGYSNGQVKLEYIDHVTPANSFGVSDEMDGWHVDAGVQLDLMKNVYAKLEYVHTNYSDYRIKEGTATITGGVDRDNVILGIGMRF